MRVQIYSRPNHERCIFAAVHGDHNLSGALMELLFWASVAALVYPYVLFPAWLIARSHRRTPPRYTLPPELPRVAIVIAAYNEEAVIARRIENLLALSYPREKLRVLIGSDASTDRTDEICQAYAAKYPLVEFIRFATRQGKAATLNRLIAATDADVLILTDADVLFAPDIVERLVAPLSDQRIGLVAARMVRGILPGDTFQQVERTYFTVESHLKYAESLLYGALIGADGACYAIRRSVFTPFPEGCLITDDLLQTLWVIERGYRTYYAPDAICSAELTTDPRHEFQRKSRVAASNMHTLRYLGGLLRYFWRAPAVLFLSHKLFRWFGALFLLAATSAALVLAQSGWFYSGAAMILVFLHLLPLLPASYRLPLLRYAAHFVASHYAVLLGIVKFFVGKRSPTWQPPPRRAEQTVPPAVG